MNQDFNAPKTCIHGIPSQIRCAYCGPSTLVEKKEDAPKPHGCICPPTSEQTCQGWNCPRKPPAVYVQAQS